MGWSFSIGTVMGTAIRLHFTFLIFLAWLAAAAWIQSGPTAAGGAVVFLLALFLCVVLHEFGHILAARHFGIRTPEIVLLPIGGVSRLERIPERPREELLMALAGPAVTLAIVIVLTAALGGPPSPAALTEMPGAGGLLAQLALVNLGLLAFNLIPAFPLDGGRVLRALLAARYGHVRGTQAAAAIGKTAAVLLGAAGLMIGHVILVLIAMFIFFAASAESGLAALRGMTIGIPAGEVMMTRFECLPSGASVGDAAEALIRTSQTEFAIVDGNGRPAGALTRELIVRALAERGPETPIAAVMRTEIPTLSRWHRLDDGIDQLQAGAPLVAVTEEDGRLAGLISWENLLELMMIRQARGRARRPQKEGIAAPARL